MASPPPEAVSPLFSTPGELQPSFHHGAYQQRQNSDVALPCVGVSTSLGMPCGGASITIPLLHAGAFHTPGEGATLPLQNVGADAPSSPATPGLQTFFTPPQVRLCQSHVAHFLITRRQAMNDSDDLLQHHGTVGAMQSLSELVQQQNGASGGVSASADGAAGHRSPGGAALEHLERQLEAEARLSQAFRSRLLHSVTGPLQHPSVLLLFLNLYVLPWRISLFRLSLQ